MNAAISPLRVRARHSKFRGSKSKSKSNSASDSASTSTSSTSLNINSSSHIIAMLDTTPFSVDKEPIELPSLADCQSDSFGGGLNVGSMGSGGNGDLAAADLPSLADTSDCGSSFSVGSCDSPLKGSSPRSNRLRRHASVSTSPVKVTNRLPHSTLERSTTVPLGTEMRIRKRSTTDSVCTRTTNNTSNTANTTITIKTMDTSTATTITPNVDTNQVDCNRYIMNSFTCLTSFLTCSTSENNVRRSCCPEFCYAGCTLDHDNTAGSQQPQRQERQDTSQQQPGTNVRQPPPLTNSESTNDIRQLQQVRERIESDILAIMGCTADSAELCMTNLGESIFCNTNEYGLNDDDDNTIASTCVIAANGLLGMTKKEKEDAMNNTRPSTMIRNRNVFVREKALRRIERMRNGGLNRTFTLAPVSAFLEEEMKGLHGSNVYSPKKSDVPNLLDDATYSSATAETSFLRKLGQKYPIQLTQSADYVTLQKATREKTYTDNHNPVLVSQRKFSNHNFEDTDTQSTISTSLLALPKQFEESIGLTRVPSAALAGSLATGGQELYYDSDPGCAMNDDLESRGQITPEQSPVKTKTKLIKMQKSKSLKMMRPLSPTARERKKKPPSSPTRVKKQRKQLKGGVEVAWKSARTVSINSDMDLVEVEESTSLKSGLRKSEEDELRSPSMKPSLLYTINVDTFDVNNVVLVSQFIEELTNGFLSLIWHPGPNQESSSPTNPTPLHTQAWFEMGTCLKSTLVQPKFMWRGAYHRPNDDDSSNANRNIKGPAFQSPHFVELLNIVRVIAPNRVDRKIYPFCRLTHAFTVGTSQEETFLFEAATEMERNRFVLGLKLVVARLASKIIVGDKGVFDDFFSPCGLRYKSKSKGSGRNKTSSPVATKRKVLKEEKHLPVGGVTGSNFIAASVNGEGDRTDELWGAA